ncbi:hypothetical protein OH76DRAFT_1477273 [Lentinus brumalis]|uniref:DUF6533 domain-containing protein n=1 Tax=Lentinus brumalis TaxID=2498619 RepID=A0A371DVX5_9APHY|nr:hypothetical protein OH76DRAFT_1477273 [Polyporus brumalis]
MNATTDADSQGELEAFVQYYANTLTFNYADLAVFAVLLFEYLITFDREVQFAWGRELSWARTIFLLNRYLSILEYLVVLGPLLPTVNYVRHVHNDVLHCHKLTDTRTSCALLTRLMQVFQIVLYIVWAAFAGLRVYAISARNFVVTVVVVVLAVVPAVTNAYVASLTSVALSDLGCMSEMDLPILTWIESVLAFRCHHATTHLTDHSVSVATRSCMIVSDALVIVTTLVKTWSTMRVARRLHVQMSFTSLILREGVLYFTIMLSLNIVQILFDFLQVGSFSFIVPFLNVITPILISRFFLDLDDLTAQQSPSYSSASGLRSLGTQSTMRFITPISTAPGDVRPAFVYRDYRSDYEVGDVGPAGFEKDYPTVATWSGSGLRAGSTRV